MAFGLADVGGVMDRPVTDSAVGYEDWGGMTGMSPSHPLVGGTSGQPGYGSYPTRQVAIAAPQATLSPGQPARAHWSELFNFKGNPTGWVLIAAILYLGLMHIHVRGGASVGVGKGR
jgi:hypothetical protein